MNRCRPSFAVLAACGVMLITAPFAWAFPKPQAGSHAWKLDFTFQTPQPISATDARGITHWYWYMPYKVVNNSGSDQLFVPDVVIADNLGHIIHAGTNVPMGLFGKIKKQLGNPLLESPMDVVGTIKQGPDFAKASVAIWPAPKKDEQSMRVFVGGLSGETATMTIPGTHKQVLLRRTLMIRFKLPGVYKTPENQPVVLQGKSQVMR